MNNFIRLLKKLQAMHFIDIVEYDEEGNVKIAYHAPLFDLKVVEEFAAGFGYAVKNVSVHVADKGRILVWMVPLE